MPAVEGEGEETVISSCSISGLLNSELGASCMKSQTDASDATANVWL